MEIFGIKDWKKRKEADCIIIPFWQTEKSCEIAVKGIKEFDSFIKNPIESKDFCGKKEESLFVYTNDNKEKRLLLLGLGQESNCTQDDIRRSLAAAILACMKKNIKEVNFLVPSKKGGEKKSFLQAISEGVFLSNYAFDKFKSKKEKNLLTKVTFLGVESKELCFLKDLQAIKTGVFLARDLVSNNADDETPQNLAKVAKSFEKLSPKVTVKVFDRKQMEKEKMGLLLAVSKGSAVEPAFIIASYNGKPSSKEHTVIVGKGITYDTGGLSLKPSTSMDTMKTDMAGAACVLGAFYSAVSLGLKINITALIPSTENAIGSRSYKPGDVYVGMSKKSVEVVNTDAEGRLILADALSYAVSKIKPTRIIDVATLTGAVVIALGEEVAGYFSNNEKLSKKIEKASKHTGEKVWRLPLLEDYKRLIKSQIADIKNVGNRTAGVITSALFLKEFVDDVPWAHIDIGGTAWLSEPKGYNPTNATGFGVRLLTDIFMDKDV